MARETFYKQAKSIEEGDETKHGIVAGVLQDESSYLVTIKYHNHTSLLNRNAPVEVYV